MKSKALRIISLILSLVIVLSCWGCSSKKDDSDEKKNDKSDSVTEKVDNGSDNGGEDLGDEFADGMTEENEEPEKENPKFIVTGVYDFVDGYSMIKTKEKVTQKEFYAFIDTNASVLGYINYKETDFDYLGSKAGKHYFYDHADGAQVIRCYDNKGAEVFAVDFSNGSPDTQYNAPVFNQTEASMLLLRRTVGYGTSGYQVALLGADGKYLCDFFDIRIDGYDFTSNTYIGNTGSMTGVLTLNTGRLNGVFVDFKTKTATLLDKPADKAGECYGDGIFVVDGSKYFVLNTSTKTLNPVNGYNFDTAGEGLVFANGSGYLDTSNNIAVDLTKYGSGSGAATPFKNGKAVFRFTDSNVVYGDQDYYYVGVDKTGKELFAPIYAGNRFSKVYSDGEYIICLNTYEYSKTSYKITDFSGNVLAQGDLEQIDDKYFDANKPGQNTNDYSVCEFDIRNYQGETIREGFVAVKRAYSSPRVAYNYLKTDGELLFADDEISFAVKAEDLQVNN